MEGAGWSLSTFADIRFIQYPNYSRRFSRSTPGVARRVDCIERVIADMKIFPSDGVMQRMRSCIAPMPIEIEFGEGRTRARQFVQLVGGENGDFGGEDFGLRDGDRRGADAFLCRVFEDAIDREPCLFEQGFGGVQFDFQLADLRDGEDVVRTALLAAVDPRPRVSAHEGDGVIDRAARDARVDRRLDDLR